MNILLIDNGFDGAYGSLKIFIEEIKEYLSGSHSVFLSRSFAESAEIFRRNQVDFSLGIGKFNQFEDGCPLYEHTKTLHYQWIIDNPLKMDLDPDSIYIKYILIDGEFGDLMPALKNPPLFLPLGVKCRDAEPRPRRDGVVFCGQIRNPQAISEEIGRSEAGADARRLIRSLEDNLDESLIRTFHDQIKNRELSYQKSVFKLANSYLRALKRKTVIQHIKAYPVILAGEIEVPELLEQANVTSLGKLNYLQAQEVMNCYMFSLNISPNFNACIHDRVLRSIQAGSCAVTDGSNTYFTYFGSSMIYYRYDQLELLEDRMIHMKREQYDKMIRDARNELENFTWEHIVPYILDDASVYAGGTNAI